MWMAPFSNRRWPNALASGRYAPLLTVCVAIFAPAMVPAGAATLPPGVTETQVTGDLTHLWGEPEIAVNPKNPDNLVYVVLGNGFTKECQERVSTDPNSSCEVVKTATGELALGLMDNRTDYSHVSFYVSFDRGKTWKKSTDIPGQIPVFPPSSKDQGISADPMIAAGPDGTFYAAWDAAHMANLPNTISDYGGITTSKSTDGGRTWSEPVFAGTANDRPFMQVDQSTGLLYEASTGPVPGPTASGDPNTTPGVNDRYLVSSKDGIHWTKPQPFGGGGLQIASAHGLLAAAFKTNERSNGLCGGAPAPCTIFQTTKDAGATWERHVVPVANSYDGRLSIRVMVAADPSKVGHFAVAMFTESDTKITVYQTHDAGKTWNAPASVTDDAGKTHYHGWMAYSPKGVLGLMWKTRNAAPGAQAPASINVFATISRDGGTTFAPPLRINSTEYPAPGANPRASGGDDFSYVSMGPDELFVAYATTGNRIGMFADVKFTAFGP
jgi:photosystem II stability/assembly factor-like uncharacterized protein